MSGADDEEGGAGVAQAAAVRELRRGGARHGRL